MKLGIRAKLYYRSAGNFGTPTWTELTLVRDLTLNAADDTTDAPTRASRVKAMAKTLKDIAFDASMRASDTDAGYTAVYDAYLSASSNIDVMVLDGSSSSNGARGFRYEAIVHKAGQPQNIADAIYTDFGFAPDAFSSNNFQSVLVTAGSPVHTNL
jgi:hypothetical protein